jgi:hypothetical protein
MVVESKPASLYTSEENIIKARAMKHRHPYVTIFTTCLKSLNIHQIVSSNVTNIVVGQNDFVRPGNSRNSGARVSDTRFAWSRDSFNQFHQLKVGCGGSEIEVVLIQDTQGEE